MTMSTDEGKIMVFGIKCMNGKRSFMHFCKFIYALKYEEARLIKNLEVFS